MVHIRRGGGWRTPLLLLGLVLVCQQLAASEAAWLDQASPDMWVTAPLFPFCPWCTFSPTGHSSLHIASALIYFGPRGALMFVNLSARVAAQCFLFHGGT
jgi:hypothetical protein